MCNSLRLVSLFTFCSLFLSVIKTKWESRVPTSLPFLDRYYSHKRKPKTATIETVYRTPLFSCTVESFLHFPFFKFSNYVFKFQSNPYHMSIHSWGLRMKTKKVADLNCALSFLIYYGLLVDGGWRGGGMLPKVRITQKAPFFLFFHSCTLPHKTKVLQTKRDVLVLPKSNLISSNTAAYHVDERCSFIVFLLWIHPLPIA